MDRNGPKASSQKSRWVALLCVLALHAVVILALNLGSPTASDTPEPAAVQIDVAPPAPAVTPTPHGRGRAGGAPPAAVKRAPARSPRAVAVIAPPTHVTPTPLVDARPATTPHLLAPPSPTLDAPATGSGAAMATGGVGAGIGDGPGGFGGDAEPHWLAFADADTVERYYPAHAYDHHIEGVAQLRCRLPTDGRPRDCRVLSQTPEGEGFGHAALELSRFCRFAPLRVAGRPTEDFLTFPIVFSLRDVEAGR